MMWFVVYLKWWMSPIQRVNLAQHEYAAATLTHHLHQIIWLFASVIHFLQLSALFKLGYPTQCSRSWRLITFIQNATDPAGHWLNFPGVCCSSSSFFAVFASFRFRFFAFSFLVNAWQKEEMRKKSRPKCCQQFLLSIFLFYFFAFL